MVTKNMNETILKYTQQAIIMIHNSKLNERETIYIQTVYRKQIYHIMIQQKKALWKQILHKLQKTTTIDS